MENTCSCMLGDSGCDQCADEQKQFDQYCISLYESHLWYREEYGNDEEIP